MLQNTKIRRSEGTQDKCFNAYLNACFKHFAVNPIEYLEKKVVGPAFVWVTAPVLRAVKALFARCVLDPAARRVQAVEAALGRRVAALPEPPAWIAPLVPILGIVFTIIVTYISGQRQEARRGERGDRVDEGERQRQRGADVDEDESSDDLGEALDTLEVEYPPAPDRDEAKAAYREKAVETHPDQGGDARKFIRVRSAWETVRDRVS